MKKNFKKLGLILSMVAITSFTMTSCAEAATEETKTEGDAPATEEVAPEVAPEVIEEVAPEAEAKCGDAEGTEGEVPPATTEEAAH